MYQKREKRDGGRARDGSVRRHAEVTEYFGLPSSSGWTV
jgi:hypothetical protein